MMAGGLRSENEPAKRLKIIVIPADLRKSLADRIATVDHPREMVVDVMFAIQDYYGYLTDEGVEETAQLLRMSPLEVEQIATFYPFVYREPVGKYVIHVCDSVICWMNGFSSIKDYLCKKLGIQVGGTTPDGLFTVLPICCIGYCDHSPAMLINRNAHGNLTSEKIDAILDKLRAEAR
jgi:NADH-quinone oxidoreductase subunit E